MIKPLPHAIEINNLQVRNVQMWKELTTFASSILCMLIPLVVLKQISIHSTFFRFNYFLNSKTVKAAYEYVHNNNNMYIYKNTFL